MAQKITLAELLVSVAFKKDVAELRQFEQGIQAATKNINERLETVNRVARGASLAIASIGAAAFASGAQAEREFAKLQTQLGDTSEQVELIRPKLRELSKETGQPLDSLAKAFFNLKSSLPGIDDAKALEIITAAAKAATIELGDVDDLARLAGIAVRQFGEDTISGGEALDILHSTIKSGNISDAGALASGMGKLLGPGKEAGLTFNELAAAVAGFTTSGASVPDAITAIRATITQLNAPSAEAQKVLDGIFPDATNSARALREMLGRDGLIETLQFLRGELGDDTQALRRLVGDVNALGFVLDATGDTADAYTNALRANRNATDSINEGLEIYKTTGAFSAERATNNLRLALEKLYNAILVPLLNLFGKIPDTIQTVVLGLGAMQVASTVGLAPSLGKLVTAILTTDWSLKLLSVRVRLLVILEKIAVAWRWLHVAATNSLILTYWRKIKTLAVHRIAMLASVIATGAATAATWLLNAALLANPITWIVLGVVALIAGLALLIKNWGAVSQAVGNAMSSMMDVIGGAIDWVKSNWPLLLAILTGPFGLAVLAVWRFHDDVVDAFTNVKDFVVGIWQSIWDFIRRVFDDIVEMPGEIVDAMPGGSLLKNVAAVLPAFQQGGIVPGSPDQAVPAVLHGGEAILPSPFVENLRRFLDGGMDAVSPAPVMAAVGGASTGGYVDRRTFTSNIAEGAIVVNASPGQDPQEIAQVVSRELRDQMQSTVEAFDSGVMR